METLPQYDMSATFEEIRAILREISESWKEHARLSQESWKESARLSQENWKERIQETDRLRQESWKEHEQRIQETDRELKEIARVVKDQSKQIGGLSNSFGELAEHLVAPGMVKKFNALGYHFTKKQAGPETVRDAQGKILTQIDVLLENGEYAIAVEVKSRPTVNDIPHHITRLELLRQDKIRKHDTKIIRGAIAGAVFPDDVKELAIEAGLYAIEQSGDTMIIDVPEDFTPREW
jgi:hypothetical protein